MKKKRILTAFLLLLLLIALFRLDRESLLYSISQFPLWLILLLIALQIVSQLLVNLQWFQIAKHTDTDISFRYMFYVNCQGAVADAITPGVKIGGEVVRALQISRICDCSKEHSAVIVALQKLFSVSSLFFIQLFAVGYLIGEVPLLQARYLQFIIYGVLLSFLFLFSVVFLMPYPIRASLQKAKVSRFLWMLKFRNFLIGLLDQVSAMRKNIRAWVILCFLSVFIWLLYPIKMYLLAVHLSPDVNAVFIGAIAFVSYMVAILPIFPGGLGGFEGAMTGLLLVAGFFLSDAAVVTILFRFITFWFVILFSLAFISFVKVCLKSRFSRISGRL